MPQVRRSPKALRSKLMLAEPLSTAWSMVWAITPDIGFDYESECIQYHTDSGYLLLDSYWRH